MKQQIRSQQETEVIRVREYQERLEQEIPELKRKDHELKLLSDTKDHIQFLRNYPSLSQLSEPKHPRHRDPSPEVLQRRDSSCVKDQTSSTGRS